MAKYSPVSIELKISKTSLKKIINDVKGYSKYIQDKGDKIAKEAAEAGCELARKIYDEAPYDGEKDVYVNVTNKRGGISKSKSSGGYTITAGGESVWFLEYGAGISYAEPYPGDIPEGVSPIGTYGQGHGSDPYWYFNSDKGDVNGNGGYVKERKDGTYSYRTYGNPPCAAMYHAFEEMKKVSHEKMQALVDKGTKK